LFILEHPGAGSGRGLLIQSISAALASASGASPFLDCRTLPPAFPFPDIPKSTDAELKRASRFGRLSTGKAKQLIAIRMAPHLLAEIRSQRRSAGAICQARNHNCHNP
jgi:hypothetical protein